MSTNIFPWAAVACFDCCWQYVIPCNVCANP